MTENTPSTNQISYGWAAFRGETSGVSRDAAYAEFNRFLAAHDQGIRDAVKPTELTAREHLVAAWDKAYPVPAGRAVPAGVAYIRRRSYPLGFSMGTGTGSFAASQNVRTLDPLPTVIPDGCNLVWSGTPDHRSVWHRDPSNPDRWNGYDVAGHTINVHRDALIDPKPVTKES